MPYKLHPFWGSKQAYERGPTHANLQFHSRFVCWLPRAYEASDHESFRSRLRRSLRRDVVGDVDRGVWCLVWPHILDGSHECVMVAAAAH